MCCVLEKDSFDVIEARCICGVEGGGVGTIVVPIPPSPQLNPKQ